MFPKPSSFVPLAALSFLGSAAAHAAPAPASAPAAPNILFILADDLGYGDLGCYGQTRLATPAIDKLAREGTRFTQFYAGSAVCAPSRNALMTGQHNGHATIRGNAKVDLTPADTTVAQLLKSAGYTTALDGKWGLGAEGGPGAPTKKGFDHFFGYVDQTHAHNYYPSFLVREDQRMPLHNVVPDEGPYGQGVATTRVDYSAALIADDALAFLDKQRDAKQPFFLYCAFTLPHANNEGKPDGMDTAPGDRTPFEKENWPAPEKGFAGMMGRLDRDVARLMEKLHALHLDENTLVIFASDNGPHREGGHDPDFFHSRGPLRGIKRDAYEGGTRVPFIARWPGHVPSGATSEHVAYFGDFLATAADLAHVAVPAGRDSLSFAPALLGHADQQPKHDYLYFEFYEGATWQSTRFGNWKAIRSPMLTGPVELYDLSTDLAESHDLAATHPTEVARARQIMQEAHVPSAHFTPPSAK